MSLNNALNDIMRSPTNVVFPAFRAIIVTQALYTFTSNFYLLFGTWSYENLIHMFTPGFRVIFSQFNLFIMILLGILTVCVFTFVAHAWISYKTKDIALAKAVGQSPAKSYSIFMREVFMIVLMGYFGGCLVGFGIYIAVFLLLDMIGYHAIFQIGWLENIMLLVVILITALFVSGTKLTSIVEKQTVAESLAGDVPFTTDTKLQLNFFVRILSKTGTHVKIAVRNLTRRRHAFRRSLAFLTVSGMLLFCATLAPACLNDNVQGYLNGTVNQDTIIIGHKEILPFIVRFYSQFSNPAQAVNEGDLNFSQPKFFFSQEKYAEFANFTEFKTIDPCTCLLEHFYEMRGIKFVDTLNWTGTITWEIYKNTTWVGHDRQGTAVVMGINKSNLQQTAFGDANFIGPEEMGNITIGDGIKHQYTDDHTLQKLRFNGKEFWMSGVVMDPCYNGIIAYMGISALWDLWPMTNNTYNLILITTPPAVHATMLIELDSFAKLVLGPEFIALSLRAPMVSNSIALLLVQWYFILIAIAAIGITVFAMIQYNKGSAFLIIKDLRIMNALGATNRFLTRSIFWENLFIVILALTLASSFGMLFVEFFLVSDPRLLPPISICFSIIWSLAGLFSLISWFLGRTIVRQACGTTLK